jgi:hypothetical protein
MNFKDIGAVKMISLMKIYTILMFLFSTIYTIFFGFKTPQFIFFIIFYSAICIAGILFWFWLYNNILKGKRGFLYFVCFCLLCSTITSFINISIYEFIILKIVSMLFATINIILIIYLIQSKELKNLSQNQQK